MSKEPKNLHLSNPGDWVEDFPHENGNYQNVCMECKNIFIGHKRRIICKECANKGKNLQEENLSNWMKNRIAEYRQYLEENPEQSAVYNALISELETILITQIQSAPAALPGGGEEKKQIEELAANTIIKHTETYPDKDARQNIINAMIEFAELYASQKAAGREWVSVEDSVPDHQHKVIIYSSSTKRIGLAWWNSFYSLKMPIPIRLGTSMQQSFT